MIIWLVLVLGGALGAMARYGVICWMVKIEQPSYVATFIVNSVGSLLMGMALHISVAEELQSAFFTVGFLGAFTTFSTFAFDIVKLMQVKEWRGVLLYPILTLFAGLMLVTLGWQIIG